MLNAAKLRPSENHYCYMEHERDAPGRQKIKYKGAESFPEFNLAGGILNCGKVSPGSEIDEFNIFIVIITWVRTKMVKFEK